MIVHRWGILEYEKARQKMDTVHQQACKDGQNHLILTSHPAVFTVGRDAWEKEWHVPVVKTDRGGSITAHSIGQNVYYFCFQAPSPARFFSKVLDAYTDFFATFHDNITYDKKNPGFYIKNRKIASLGFRYTNGVSLHGVALNVDVDLAWQGQINPCDLEGIIPTSLHQESIMISPKSVDEKILMHILEHFDESL